MRRLEILALIGMSCLGLLVAYACTDERFVACEEALEYCDKVDAVVAAHSDNATIEKQLGELKKQYRHALERLPSRASASAEAYPRRAIKCKHGRSVGNLEACKLLEADRRRLGECL